MAGTPTITAKAPDWVNLALGVLLFLSPWIIGFSAIAGAAWNAWIFGVVLAALSIAAVSVFAEWEEWVNLVIGIWLIISPWVIGFSAAAGALWTHLILGVLVVVASIWAIREHRHGTQATA